MVPVDLGCLVERHVVTLCRCGQQHRCFDLGEGHRRLGLGCPVGSEPRPRTAPQLCCCLRLGQTAEVLTRPKRGLDELDSPLHPPFVLRRTHACGVDQEPTRLGVFDERHVQHRVQRVGLRHHRRHVVGLCRCRHSPTYADPATMPTSLRKAVPWLVVMVSVLGIVTGFRGTPAEHLGAGSALVVSSLVWSARGLVV
jgi:hypothetical protein